MTALTRTSVELFIGGRWVPGSTGHKLPVYNPANGSTIAEVAAATRDDLDQALQAAEGGFKVWRKTSAYERSLLLRRAATILRTRADDTARVLTQEQGKPLAEAKNEIIASAEMMEWFSEEARRCYGRVIPARAEGVTQLSLREPVGPVAAFTPWNFPINLSARKISAALAAGCSVILKGPEETPVSCAELVRVFVEAGLPDGVLNLVFGDPAEISAHLIAHPTIRKLTFTGSTSVGKQLAALAGQHMKRVSMELGGHAPVLVFDDADILLAARTLASGKFRNAGQVCVSPTRFLVQEGVYDQFIEAFGQAVRKIQVGDGLLAHSMMGPLANPRRLDAMQRLVENARNVGARLIAGGERIGDKGNFFAPTLLADVPVHAHIMNSEPFGPVAAARPFKDIDTALEEANRLPYGLASYAFTRSLKTANAVSNGIECGMVSINHLGIGLPELPFGGIKDSGYGSEGGSEAIQDFLNVKMVTQIGL